jgi:hypothetical protein
MSEIKVDRCTVSTTRKTRFGDFFVSFSAEVEGSPIQAANVLSLKASVCALNHAFACSAVSEEDYPMLMEEIKAGYANLIGGK